MNPQSDKIKIAKALQALIPVRNSPAFPKYLTIVCKGVELDESNIQFLKAILQNNIGDLKEWIRRILTPVF